jgi:hypothetical protein
VLEFITAIEYVGPVGNGRTQPLHLVCEKSDGSNVEVITKFSGSCDEGVVNLAREVIAACLAADLALPVPVPYLVEISPAFADIIPDAARKDKAKKSAPVAFGSTLITRQFSTWLEGTRISDVLLPVATAIFVFDAIIQNPDRRVGNANCIVKSDACRIFDHELCFTHDKILFWKPPWTMGGLNNLKTPGNHIFSVGLHGKKLDFSDIRDRWKGLSDARLLTYENAIPTEWSAAMASVKASLKLIRDARENIDDCIKEIERVLT